MERQRGRKRVNNKDRRKREYGEQWRDREILRKSVKTIYNRKRYVKRDREEEVEKRQEGT